MGLYTSSRIETYVTHRAYSGWSRDQKPTHMGTIANWNKREFLLGSVIKEFGQELGARGKEE